MGLPSVKCAFLIFESFTTPLLQMALDCKILADSPKVDWKEYVSGIRQRLAPRMVVRQGGNCSRKERVCSNWLQASDRMTACLPRTDR